ncbi:Hsp70 family protein [Amycolatopsis sp. NPDC059657]|uniref:Hsp70 family protein n=1 Tax=Amycolatopsis sp. NPDC059657 TaxID=3346899 RepID=UPI003672AF80
MPYVVGIDLGHTRTTAAVCRRAQGTWGDPDVVAFEGGARWFESVLHVGRDGSSLIGQDALRRAVAEPDGLARGFMSRVGDDIPMLVGGARYPAELLAATLAGWVVDEVADLEGGPADRIVLTHPPGWGPHRRAVLHASLEAAGLPGVLLLPSPIAAAESPLVREAVDVGSVLAACRLGGEHVESAILRRNPAGFEILTHVDGSASGAGARLDDLLFDYVLETAGVEATETVGLRAACREAKERLSLAPEVSVSLGALGEMPLTRAEFEHLARPVLATAIERLCRVATPLPAAVALVGGSARVPLVTDLAQDKFGCPVIVDPDPGTAVCRGAALAARPRMAPQPEFVPPPVREEVAVFDDEPEPPPRPPVEITPLEPPKRFVLPGRKAGGRDD